MRLKNTQTYYEDLAVYYRGKKRFYLEQFFIGLATRPREDYSKTNTNPCLFLVRDNTNPTLFIPD